MVMTDKEVKQSPFKFLKAPYLLYSESDSQKESLHIPTININWWWIWLKILMIMDIDDSQNFWPTVQLIMAIVTKINTGNDNKSGVFKQYDGRTTRFILPNTLVRCELLWTWQWTFRLYTIQITSSPPEELLASQERLSSMYIDNNLKEHNWIPIQSEPDNIVLSFESFYSS